MLSGVLITKSIISNVRRYGYFDPVDYLTSRAARIYPPFILALLTTVSVVAIVQFFGLPGWSGPLGQLRPDGLVYAPQELWKSLLLYDGLTGVNGPLWTLYIEVKLYLLAMGLALIAAGRSTVHRLVGIAVCAFIALYWVRVDLGFWFFAAIWAFGASLNLKPKAWVRASSVILAAVAFFYPPFDLRSYLDGNTLGLELQALGCIAFAFIYLIPTYAERPWPRRLLKTADYSYTLYVIHFPLLALGLSLSIAGGFTSPLGAAVSLVVTATVTLVLVMMVAPWVEDVKRFKRLLVWRPWPQHA